MVILVIWRALVILVGGSQRAKTLTSVRREPLVDGFVDTI